MKNLKKSGIVFKAVTSKRLSEGSCWGMNLNAFYDIWWNRSRKKLGWDLEKLNPALAFHGLSSQHWPGPGKMLETLCWKRSQQDRGGQKSTRVCGSHCGILQSPRQFGESHLYLEESEIPRRTAAEPCACASWTGHLSWGWGRAGSVGDVWSLQGGTKICLLCAVFAVEEPQEGHWAVFRRCQDQWTESC